MTRRCLQVWIGVFVLLYGVELRAQDAGPSPTLCNYEPPSRNFLILNNDISCQPDTRLIQFHCANEKLCLKSSLLKGEDNVNVKISYPLTKERSYESLEIKNLAVVGSTLEMFWEDMRGPVLGTRILIEIVRPSEKNEIDPSDVITSAWFQIKKTKSGYVQLVK